MKIRYPGSVRRWAWLTSKLPAPIFLHGDDEKQRHYTEFHISGACLGLRLVRDAGKNKRARRVAIHNYLMHRLYVQIMRARP